MAQMIGVYERTGLPIISMHAVTEENVVHYGIMHGQWENQEQTILKLDSIIEKPTVEYARDYLKVKTKKIPENYYAVFGQYVLTKEVFEVLGKNIKDNKCQNGEIQLTDALEQTRRRIGMVGYLVDGISYDVGLPEMYVQTVCEYYK